MAVGKVLLIIPRWTAFSGNSDVFEFAEYYHTFPLGVPYLCAALKAHGIECDVLNLPLADGIDAVRIHQQLDSTTYSIVGFGGNSLIYPRLKLIVDAVRQHPSGPITVLGGIAMSSEPRFSMEALHPDYGLVGDGEITLPRLCSDLFDGKAPDFPGLWQWDKTNNLKGSPTDGSMIPDLDKIPFPDYGSCGFTQWLEHLPCNSLPALLLQDTFHKRRYYQIMGSRGCPFHCSFCFHITKYRERSMENIFAELEEAYRKYHFNSLILLDDLFCNRQERVMDFCDRLDQFARRTGEKFEWFAQGMVNRMSRELLLRMKEAGCRVVSYGFESFDCEVLRSMHKPIHPEEIAACYKLTHECGLGVSANFIFGDIAETMDSWQTTIEYWRKNCTKDIDIFPIIPLPDSEIYRHCFAIGKITDKNDYFMRQLPLSNLNNMNFTRIMTDEEHAQMLREIQRLSGQALPVAIGGGLRKNSDMPSRYSLSLHCPWCKKRILQENLELNRRTLIANRHSMRGFWGKFYCPFCSGRYLLFGGFFFLAYCRSVVIPAVLPGWLRTLGKKALRPIRSL
ncbi:MAG: radical SAM protein [Victivallaceae bacterium]|nr:radical SAM protein [Victivallaceae bacterium]